jgi:hypothetical protein
MHFGLGGYLSINIPKSGLVGLFSQIKNPLWFTKRENINNFCLKYYETKGLLNFILWIILFEFTQFFFNSLWKFNKDKQFNHLKLFIFTFQNLENFGMW